jgi:hypothetical protein
VPSERSRRRAVAAAARQYLDGNLTYEELKRDFYDDTDRDIDDLFDLIIHEPSRSGILTLFTVSDPIFLSYRDQVLEIVRRLETDPLA